MIKQAVILAGGKGTRLKERLNNQPKPLIKVCDIPLLERQILTLKSYGIKKILLLVNYKYNEIIKFCSSKNNWNLKIDFKIDNENYSGTSGALLSAMDKLESDFLVVYGDTLFNIDINRFENFHVENNSDITLYLHPNDHPYDSDLVQLDDSKRVVKFYSYPHNTNMYYPNLVNAAFYLIKKSALNNVEIIKNVSDLAKDLFPDLIKKVKIMGYNCSEYIKDCGTPERLDKCEFDLKNEIVKYSSLKYYQKAVFLDRDGTINYERGFISNPAQIKLFDNVGKSIYKLKEKGFLVIIITNQPVLARGDCSEDDLNQIHWKIEKLLSNDKTYIDKIYFCPHHPDSGFRGEVKKLKIICDCRKPKTGLIDRSISDYNIDVKNSWFIGDSTADIGAAYNSNIKSILVETGNGGKDKKYNFIPDFRSKNIETAIEGIINNNFKKGL